MVQRQGGGGGARCGDRPAGPGERAAGRGEKEVGCRGLLGPRERKGGRAGLLVLGLGNWGVGHGPVWAVRWVGFGYEFPILLLLFYFYF